MVRPGPQPTLASWTLPASLIGSPGSEQAGTTRPVFGHMEIGFPLRSPTTGSTSRIHPAFARASQKLHAAREWKNHNRHPLPGQRTIGETIDYEQPLPDPGLRRNHLTLCNTPFHSVWESWRTFRSPETCGTVKRSVLRHSSLA